jgi:transcriptional regulator with XRE-family HTH domain
VTFRGLLKAEFDRRRAGNRRYSLRAFARSLAIDHSALSQILRGNRRVTTRTIRALGSTLRLSPATIAEHCAAEHEAAVLATLDRPGFRADSRWVAAVAGIPLDEVNATLQRLLRKRMMTMSARAIWQRAGEEARG